VLLAAVVFSRLCVFFQYFLFFSFFLLLCQFLFGCIKIVPMTIFFLIKNMFRRDREKIN